MYKKKKGDPVMNFVQYIMDQYTMLFQLVGLLIVLGISAHISDRTKRLTRIVVVLLFAESLSVFLERWTQTLETLSIARPLLSAFVYSIYPIILIMVISLIEREKLPWKKILILLIPEIICVPIFFTTQWTHIVCWWTEDNRYQGGLISFLPYILFGLYTFYFLIQNLIFLKKYTRRERFLAIYIVIIPLLGVILNKVLDTGDDYSGLFTAGLIMYFMSVYIHMAKTDHLTGLFNRQTYYLALKNDWKSISAVISIDMNELKYINDRDGHNAGDVALKTIAEVIRSNCSSSGIVYRVGGDEFIILYTNTEEAQIVKDVERMREKMSETSYSCAFGYAMAQKDMDIEELLTKADAEMYKDKAEIKAEMHARGEILHNR